MTRANIVLLLIAVFFTPKSLAQDSTCQDALNKVLESNIAIGAYVPQCDQEGNYETTQCHASTGECWCAEKISGKEIDETRVRPGQQIENCDQLQPTTLSESTTKLDESDICYQQNKKMLDEWYDKMSEYQAQLDRWKTMMDEYDAYVANREQ